MNSKKLAGIVASAVLSILFIATPVLVAESLLPLWLGLLVSLVPTLVVISVFIAKVQKSQTRFLLSLALLVGLYLISESGLLKSQNVCLINFCAINAILLKQFSGSLRRNQVPLCTRFAMLVHESISPQLAAYTRALTYSWAIFFGLQILIWSTLFFVLSTRLWSELISLVPPALIVVLFAIDLAARQRWLPYEDRKDSLVRTIKSLLKHRQNLKQAVVK